MTSVTSREEGRTISITGIHTLVAHNNQHAPVAWLWFSTMTHQQLGGDERIVEHFAQVRLQVSALAKMPNPPFHSFQFMFQTLIRCLIFQVDYDQDLFSEAKEDMIEACSLLSFSTTTPVSSSSESRNSAKEVIEESDLVVVGLRSFWPSSASACCSAVFNWWRCSLREAGLVSLKSVSLPCLGVDNQNSDEDVRDVQDDHDFWDVNDNDFNI